MNKVIKPSGWRGITSIDQKVICVEEFQSYCNAVRALPQKGTIYRVAGFADCAGGAPGIFLREIDPPHCSCWNMKLPFEIRGFRPLDEVLKKNEHVTNMLKDILERVTERKQVTEDA